MGDQCSLTGALPRASPITGTQGGQGTSPHLTGGKQTKGTDLAQDQEPSSLGDRGQGEQGCAGWPSVGLKCQALLCSGLHDMIGREEASDWGPDPALRSDKNRVCGVATPTER